MNGPKIVAIDVELSFTLSYHYDQWGVNIPWTRIKHRPFMISAAWQVIGEEEIHTVSVLDNKSRFRKNHRDDYHVIKTIRKALKDADAIIAYNGKSFDVKEINTGLSKHGFDPLHDYITIDPYQIAKSKFRMTGKGGNSLAHLCDFYKLDVQKGGISEEDWIAATEGCRDAIKKVIEYNILDIPTMVAVWKRVAPFGPTTLNMNLFVDEVEVCPSCGSPELELHKVRKTARATKKHQYQCKECGKYSTRGSAIKTVSIR